MEKYEIEASSTVIEYHFAVRTIYWLGRYFTENYVDPTSKEDLACDPIDYGAKAFENILRSVDAYPSRKKSFEYLICLKTYDTFEKAINEDDWTEDFQDLFESR